LWSARGRIDQAIYTKSEKEMFMNKVLLAFGVIALAAPAFSPLEARDGCADTAEMKFPTDRIAPKDFSKARLHDEAGLVDGA
jgi:hypothetical protein